MCTYDVSLKSQKNQALYTNAHVPKTAQNRIEFAGFPHVLTQRVTPILMNVCSVFGIPITYILLKASIETRQQNGPGTYEYRMYSQSPSVCSYEGSYDRGMQRHVMHANSVVYAIYTALGISPLL